MTVALLMLELESIAVGTEVVDAMVKRARVEVLRTGTVEPGKYVVLVCGQVAEVEECHAEALLRGAEELVDAVFLPDVDPQVHAAIEGRRQDSDGDALGIIESATVPAIVRAADRAAKIADVQVIEIRLADDLGGKGVIHLTGKLEDVQSAVEAGVAAARESTSARSVVIPAQHPELQQQLGQSTRFWRSTDGP